MDTTGISRGLPTLPPQTQPWQPADGERTQLAPAQAVTPAVEVTLTPRAAQRRTAETPAAETPAGDVERQFVNDPATKELVFRISDGSSGSIVYQIPSEEALKLRAYNEQAGRTRSSTNRVPGTEV